MRLSLLPRFSRFLLTFFFAYALVLTIFCPPSYSGEVTLAWDASSDATVVGYKIYRGTSTGIYDYEKDVGDVTTAVITGLDTGTDYYFSATAYNSNKDESNFCNEVKVSVQPVDTDKDGISDSDELSVYGTNPNNPDTDGDGLSDGEELTIWQNSWNADSDNDGIINLLDKDSDGDGFSDGVEVSNGSDPASYNAASPANQPPSGINDQYSVTSDKSLSITASNGVLSNDNDPEGAQLEAVLVSGPSRGSLELFTDGSFTYTPDPGFVGTDSFTYYPSDGVQNGNTATATVRVAAATNALRVSEGLVALYDFKEGAGTTVRDVSGFGTPLDLSISNPSAVNWIADGGLSIDASIAIRSTGSSHQNHRCAEGQPGVHHRSLGHTGQHHSVRTGAHRGPFGDRLSVRGQILCSGPAKVNPTGHL